MFSVQLKMLLVLLGTVEITWRKTLQKHLPTDDLHVFSVQIPIHTARQQFSTAPSSELELTRVNHLFSGMTKNLTSGSGIHILSGGLLLKSLKTIDLLFTINVF
jgi:hypothetical protein